MTVFGHVQESPANPTARLVLELVRSSGELTRGELVVLARVPRSTLVEHVRVLLRRGLLVERPAPLSGRRGRPGTVLALPTAPHPSPVLDGTGEIVLAAVLRHGTSFANGPVQGALLEADGSVIGMHQTDAGGDPLAAGIMVLQQLLVQHRIPSARVRRPVLAVPFPLVLGDDGQPVSSDARIVPPYAHVLGPQPHARLTRELRADTLLANDADLGALGEKHWGIGRRFDDFLFVKCLTGLGIGVMQNGRLMSAGGHSAGEIEHMAVKGGGPCSCGGSRCRGGRASSTGALELTQRLRTYGADVSSLPRLQAAVQQGDPRCLTALHAFGQEVGQALASVQPMGMPATIVIEAGLGPALTPFTDGIRHALARWGVAFLQGRVRITESLAGHAEILGAVAAAGGPRLQ